MENTKVFFKVYSLSHCPYCVSAKELLTKEGFAFDEVVVAYDDDKTRKDLLDRTGMKTFPQIFAGDKLVGGYSDLKKLYDETNLEQFRG